MNIDTALDLPSLVSRAQRGEMEAQDRLVRTYQSRIAAFLYAMSGRSEAVEDLTQAVFIKMLLALPKLKEIERFEAWLFRMARNTYLDHYRRERLRQFFIPATALHEQIAAPETYHSPRLDRLTQALQVLPPNQRELLVLVQENDWSYEELAEMTRSTVGAVKSRLFRAREHLKQLLPDES